MTLTASQTSFLDRIFPHAQTASAATGVDPYVIMSQAALESGWGAHAPNNNFFGIKGPGGTQQTTEFVNGQPVQTSASFAGYADLGASVAGWADFINKYKRYDPVQTAGTPQGQIAALGASGYATDPNYAGKLSTIYQSIVSGFSGGSANTGSNFRGRAKRPARRPRS